MAVFLNLPYAKILDILFDAMEIKLANLFYMVPL